MKLFGQNEFALARGLQLVARPVVGNVHALATLQQIGALPGEARRCAVRANRAGRLRGSAVLRTRGDASKRRRGGGGQRCRHFLMILILI